MVEQVEADIEAATAVAFWIVIAILAAVPLAVHWFRRARARGLVVLALALAVVCMFALVPMGSLILWLAAVALALMLPRREDRLSGRLHVRDLARGGALNRDRT